MTAVEVLFCASCAFLVLGVCSMPLVRVRLPAETATACREPGCWYATADRMPCPHGATILAVGGGRRTAFREAPGARLTFGLP